MKKWLKNCFFFVVAMIAIAFIICFFAWKGVASSVKPLVEEAKATEAPDAERKDELTLWFETSDKELKDIGKNIEGSISEAYQIAEKYASEQTAGKEKIEKGLALLKEAEELRVKARGGNWPQVLQQWVLKSEEELDGKIAEIKTSVEELKASGAGDEAMQKDAEESLVKVKERLAEFKKVNTAFQEAWDKAKLRKMSGKSCDEIKEELDQTIKATDNFISEAKEIEK